MSKLLFSVLLIFIFQSASSQKSDVEILTGLNRDWLDSYSKKDAATMDKIFADDFVLISPRGTKMTKSDIIGNLKIQEVLSMHVDSLDVRILTADVGIIIAYTTFTVKADGKEMTGQNCYQDVYMKRNGRWVAVAAHVTLLR